jgi:hypothetical protein
MSHFTDDGVDVTLIQWMLSMTPAERLAVLENFVNDLEEIREYNAKIQLPRIASNVG